jgi:endogenous inhibitor of DNA gyrase (YacG/DUF329 family)
MYNKPKRKTLKTKCPICGINGEKAENQSTSVTRSLEPFAERRKCANCGHWAPLIVTSAIRPKRTLYKLGNLFNRYLSKDGILSDTSIFDAPN